MATTFARPPDFLALAGHPVRWQLLKELSWSDRQVGELVALSGRPQNLVSYHLGKLRTAEMVSRRRSAADARDAYYSLDLERSGGLIVQAAAALHPGLCLVPAGPSAAEAAPATRVLFLCTGNSARSQMAEGFLERHAPRSVRAGSAGSQPKPLHPFAVDAMLAHGIDISGRRSKHLDEFAQHSLDYVVTLCDRVREVCPEFPGPARRIHWSIPDPAGGAAEPAAFEGVAREIETRVRFLSHLIAANAAPSQEVRQP